jgi:hypothetical protein
MAYSRGTNANIIVGAAALFAANTTGVLSESSVPVSVSGVAYNETLSNNTTGVTFRNVGYTSNGLELMFEPDFGEVKVDQILDVAKLYKQGMKVSMKTSFAESTLENLLLAIARPTQDAYVGTSTHVTSSGNDTYDLSFAGEDIVELSAGNIGECPIERGLIAVGPGTGDCTAGSSIERIYIAYRALSIESVTVSAKREEATMFEVNFRLLPNDNGVYGKIVDRTVNATTYTAGGGSFSGNKPGFPS